MREGVPATLLSDDGDVVEAGGRRGSKSGSLIIVLLRFGRGSRDLLNDLLPRLDRGSRPFLVRVEGVFGIESGDLGSGGRNRVGDGRKGSSRDLHSSTLGSSSPLCVLVGDSSEEGDAGIGGEAVLRFDFVHCWPRLGVRSGVVVVVDEGMLGRRSDGHITCFGEAVVRREEVEQEKGTDRRLT